MAENSPTSALEAAGGVATPSPDKVIDAAAYFAPAERVNNYGVKTKKGWTLETAEAFYYDEGARRFYQKNTAGEMVDLAANDFARELRKMGVRSKVFASEGELVSPMELVISDVQLNHRVNYAGPLAGYKAGFYKRPGAKILVTESPDLVEPKAGEFPMLRAFFKSLLFDEEKKIDQAEWLWLWIKLTLECLYSGEWAIPGSVCLVICGPGNSGKSLLSKLIAVLFGGRYASPFAFMAGQDTFNEELYEASLLLIDDKQTHTDLKSRLLFAANIKEITAAGFGRMRGMQKKARNLSPLWRLMIICNDEIDRMQVIPPLDDDLVDKMLILKGFKNEFPFPLRTPAEKLATWAALVAELPAFVHFLLHEWTVPEEIKGERFGVEAWQHPVIAEALMQTAPELGRWELIERVMAGMAVKAFDQQETNYSSEREAFCGRLLARRWEAENGEKRIGWKWMGTATELATDLKSTEAGLSRDEHRDIGRSNYIGQSLTKLGRVRPGGASFEQKHTGKMRLWTIKSGEGAPE